MRRAGEAEPSRTIAAVAAAEPGILWPGLMPAAVGIGAVLAMIRLQGAFTQRVPQRTMPILSGSGEA
jgi:hypothetical protein